jgi:type IV pilus assembly protein PilA
VTEGIVAADACKSSVVEYVASMNALPANINQAGCTNKASQYISSLTYTAGTGEIQTVFQHISGGDVDGTHYSLKPTSTASVASGQITGWTCTGSNTPPQLLPASCRG